MSLFEVKNITVSFGGVGYMNQAMVKFSLMGKISLRLNHITFHHWVLPEHSKI